MISRPKVWRRTIVRYHPSGNGILYDMTKLCFGVNDGGTANISLRKDIKAVSLPRNMAVINLEFTAYCDCIISTIPYSILASIREILVKSLNMNGYLPHDYYCIQECQNGILYRFSIFIKLGNQSFLKKVTSIVDYIKQSLGCLPEGFLRSDNNDFIIETAELHRHRLMNDLWVYISFSDWFKIQEGYYPQGHVVKSYRLMPQPDRFNEF